MENAVILLVWAGLVFLFLTGWRTLLRDVRGYFLRKKAGRFSQQRATAEYQGRAPEILAKVEAGRDLTAFPQAFGLLATSADPALKLRVSQVITRGIRLLPVIRLTRLDALFRERTSLEWAIPWERVDLSYLLLPSLSESERTVILGLTSFHPNGHVREKAVTALSGITSGDELPYLIIRLNDWVPAIWNRTKRAVLERLQPPYAGAIVRSLPLICGLQNRSRYAHYDLIKASLAVLSTPGARPELELGLQSRDIAIRRYCYQAVIEAGIIGRSALIERLLKEPSPMIRSLAFGQIRARLTSEDLRPYRGALLRDRSAAVRMTALKRLHEVDAAATVPDLEQAIFDENPAVRGAARDILGRSSRPYDFRGIYREALACGPAFRPGAIAGLGETGRPEDAKFIAPCLKADRVRTVRAGIRALAKLDFAMAKGFLISLVGDARPGVVKEARRLLHGRIDAADAALIHRDHFRNRPDPQRRQAAFLLCGLDKWEALPYILEICADPSQRVGPIGQAALAKWILRYNASFIAPSPDQIEAAQTALREYGSAVREETRRLLEFILKGFRSGETGPLRLEGWKRPGVIDLRDLSWRNSADRLAIVRFLEAAKLTPSGPASTSFAPPRIVMAVVPEDGVSLLERSRAWLEDAARVIVVRDREGSIAASDPSLEEGVLSDWRDALAAFRVPIEVFEWRHDSDVHQAIRRASELARTTVQGPPSSAPPPILEHPPGPRIAASDMPGGVDFGQLIASHLVPRGDRIELFAGNAAVNLGDATAVVRFDDDDARGAVTPRGQRLVLEKFGRWRVGDHHFEAPGDTTLGFDGHYPVGWTGHRMAEYWLYGGTSGVGFLSAVDHDYPCGPAKKRYGYEDNYPVGVSLAPDLGAVAYRFEHDILMTSAVPIPWREAGPVQVADFPHDPSRALFFAQAPDRSGVDDLLDDDARDHAPGFVLGPSAESRYALDLRGLVYRITSVKPWEGTVARVGGPGEGFAVFNEAHQEVRRATGRLLDGWWRWATVLDDGAYWREDLATGERRRIAPAAVTPVVAVGVPWTKNVVLVLEDEGRLWVQLL